MAILRRLWALAAVPVVSILLALLLGSVLIVVSSLATEKSLNLLLPLVAYESLLQGATGLSFLNVTGKNVSLVFSIDFEQAGRALTNTVAAASPLVGILTGVGGPAAIWRPRPALMPWRRWAAPSPGRRQALPEERRRGTVPASV